MSHKRFVVALVVMLGTGILAAYGIQAVNASAPTEMAGAQAVRIAAAEAAPACTGKVEATVSNAEGPFYKSGAPERTVLVEPGMTGTRLLLTGQVLTTDCQPVAGPC